MAGISGDRASGAGVHAWSRSHLNISAMRKIEVVAVILALASGALGAEPGCCTPVRKSTGMLEVF